MGIMLSCRAFVVSCALGAGLVAAGPAGAAPATTGLPPNWRLTSATVAGDITGDGLRDRFELAQRQTPDQSSVCGVLLRAGTGNGGFAAPVLYRLPVGDLGGECPELGVVVTAPTAAANRLAVTTTASSATAQVFDFGDGRFTYQSRFDAGLQPDVLATRDFDGDGYGDLYTLWGNGYHSTTAVVSRGRTWTTLYDNPGAQTEPQFLDLNRDGGTDLMVSWSRECSPGECVPGGVDLVDGRTGQKLELARVDDYQKRVTGRFYDENHDRYLDVEVTTTTTTDLRVIGFQTFINRSQGGGWSFVPVPTP